jgi:hypothetical protein
MSSKIAVFIIVMSICSLSIQAANKSNKSDTSSSSKSPKKVPNTRPPAYAIGVQGGLGAIQGDVPWRNGYAFGLNVRRSIGYIASIRLDYNYNTIKGLDVKKISPNQLTANEMYNGTLYTNLNYASANEKIINNYHTKAHNIGLSFLFSLNNVNYEFREVQWNYYLSFNLGTLLYHSYTDQLKGGNLYNYDTIFDVNQGRDKKSVKRSLKSWYDGEFETEVKSQPASSQLLGFNLGLYGGVGLGVEKKLGDNLQIGLEGNYNLTNGKILDGSYYTNTGSKGSLSDRYITFQLRISYKLGKDDSKYWFKNPLTLPQKDMKKSKMGNSIIQNIYGGDMDSIMQIVNILRSDNDSDGVSDYFDKEPNTPRTAIVDGAGRTLFIRDEDNNLVFNDPNSTSNNFDPDGTTYSINEKGEKVKKYPDGRIYERTRW